MAEKRGRPPNKPYSKLSEIPPHIFKNRILTEPVGGEFKEYLRYMLEKNPDDLHYLYRQSQKYINHGGAWGMPFDRWRNQLANNLQKYEKEDSS